MLLWVRRFGDFGKLRVSKYIKKKKRVLPMKNSTLALRIIRIRFRRSRDQSNTQVLEKATICDRASMAISMERIKETAEQIGKNNVAIAQNRDTQNKNDTQIAKDQHALANTEAQMEQTSVIQEGVQQFQSKINQTKGTSEKIMQRDSLGQQLVQTVAEEEVMSQKITEALTKQKQMTEEIMGKAVSQEEQVAMDMAAQQNASKWLALCSRIFVSSETAQSAEAAEGFRITFL